MFQTLNGATTNIIKSILFRKPVLEIDKYGNKKVYRSLSEFEEYGIHYQYIQNAIKKHAEYKGKSYSFISLDEYKKMNGN